MELEPAKKLGVGVVGMMLFFGSNVEDPSKLNHKQEDTAPFFDITVPKQVKDGDKMWNAFHGYASGLDSLVRNDMPKLLDQMQDVARKVDDVAEKGTDQIEALGAMQKVKAGVNLPKNVQLLKDQAQKMPIQAEQLKQELENLKNAAAELKETMDGDKFKDGCKQLKEKPQPDARMSYREVFEMPPFSNEEWADWTKWADSKKMTYDPKDYGKS